MDAQAWYERWLEAWNENRPELCSELLTADFVLSTPTTRNAGDTVTGPEGAGDYLRYVLAMYPDLRWEQTGPPLSTADGARVAFTWRGAGHFTGRIDPPGIDGTGKRFEFTGVEVFDFDGDRACRLDVSYDLLGLLKQTGVLR